MQYFNWLTAIVVLQFVHSDASSKSNNHQWSGKCPIGCKCFVTEGERNATICSEGKFFYFSVFLLIKKISSFDFVRGLKSQILFS